MKYELFPVFPGFIREDSPVAVEEGIVDSAGYRPIAAMVQSFREAGIQLEVFRASEFDGDLALNPLYQNYVDPVDRDAALTEAAKRADEAVKLYEKARRDAIDKRNEEFENRVVAAAEARRLAYEAKRVPASAESSVS